MLVRNESAHLIEVNLAPKNVAAQMRRAARERATAMLI
jgi:hypothetical protein